MHFMKNEQERKTLFYERAETLLRGKLKQKHQRREN